MPGRLIALAAGLLPLAGCVPPAVTLPDRAGVELASVPFFPQSAHQCGPAALATILSGSGVPVTPEALTPEVYIPGKRGSLQPELLAATRRAGRLPYMIDGSPTALLAELDAGNPVLVLQNLGLEKLPWWHYAVVVGYDPADRAMILRSGKERTRRESTAAFFRSWDLADRWGFVATAPARIPGSAEPGSYVRTLVQSAPFLPDGAKDEAFAAAATRWPADPLVAFAAANHWYGRGDLARAEALYRNVLRADPGQVAARNNLANLLLGRGCREAALREAREAMRLAGEQPELAAAVADTVRDIEAAPVSACIENENGENGENGAGENGAGTSVSEQS